MTYLLIFVKEIFCCRSWNRYILHTGNSHL